MRKKHVSRPVHDGLKACFCVPTARFGDFWGTP